MVISINEARFVSKGSTGFSVVMIMALLLLVSMVKQYLKTKAQNKALAEELETDYELPPVDAVNAVVLAKDIIMEKNVISPEKIVRTHKLIYNIKFSTENRDVVEYDVPRELFEKIFVGQKGILATVEGEFFDFGDGEEINL